MKLMGIAQFREQYFYDERSAPTMQTLRTWIDNDKIPGGRRIGNKYFVDIHVWEAGDDPLVAKVLAETT